MLIDPSNTNTLYLAESDTQDGYAAVLRTTDGGQNWFVLWDSFFGLQAGLQALAIDPAHPGTLYVGTDDILSGFPSVQVQPGMRGLFKSTDAGATWYDTGLTKNAVNLLAVDPSNPLTLYAGTEGPATQPTGFQGVFKSSNAGAAWQAVNKGLEALMNNALTTGTALAVDPANPSALYLGTGNAGVFRSLDAGATWSALNDGLGNLQVRALLVSPKPHAVYAATPSGVFKIVDQ
jgi:photosystem II stability/assembly factor-like uncharacterized protein